MSGDGPVDGVGVERWRAHTPFTDPGAYREVLAALPGDVAGIGARLRGVLTHYVYGGRVGVGERWEEIDLRWVEAMLATDAVRGGRAWSVGRSVPLVGCCRDFALVTVAALREHGVAARTRVGFASYLNAGFGTDHVVVEYWDGRRWVWVDTQLDPAGGWGVDVLDLSHEGAVGQVAFSGASAVWLAVRSGEVDGSDFGVAPELPMLRGGWLVRDYVWLEVAHRLGVETLLWDQWGAMGRWGENELTDEVAGLVVGADAGDGGAEEALAEWFWRDGRLNPRGRVYCGSPSGYRGWVDLVSRVAEPRL
ncbi:transglutaminase-like domain-containing protein [Nocardiopsis nanhaiensis]